MRVEREDLTIIENLAAGEIDVILPVGLRLKFAAREARDFMVEIARAVREIEDRSPPIARFEGSADDFLPPSTLPADELMEFASAPRAAEAETGPPPAKPSAARKRDEAIDRQRLPGGRLRSILKALTREEEATDSLEHPVRPVGDRRS
jgi:hypothetical protein